MISLKIGSGMLHSSFHQAGISKLSGFILLTQPFTENNNLMLVTRVPRPGRERMERGEERID